MTLGGRVTRSITCDPHIWQQYRIRQHKVSHSQFWSLTLNSYIFYIKSGLGITMRVWLGQSLVTLPGTLQKLCMILSTFDLPCYLKSYNPYTIPIPYVLHFLLFQNILLHPALKIISLSMPVQPSCSLMSAMGKPWKGVRIKQEAHFPKWTFSNM